MSTFLECEVCMDIFNNTERRPRVLPCGHTLCEKCIAKVIETSDGHLNCPFCQLPSNKENSKTTVTDFPVLIKMLNMLECEPKVPSSFDLTTSPSSKEKIFGHLENIVVNSYASLKQVIEKFFNLQRKCEVQSSVHGDLELYLIVNEPKVGKGWMKVTKTQHIFIHSLQTWSPDVDNSLQILVGEDNEPSSLSSLWKKTNIEDLIVDNNIKVFLDLALDQHDQSLGRVVIRLNRGIKHGQQLLLLCLGVWGHTLKGSNFGGSISSSRKLIEEAITHGYYVTTDGFLSKEKLLDKLEPLSSYAKINAGFLCAARDNYGFVIATSTVNYAATRQAYEFGEVISGHEILQQIVSQGNSKSVTIVDCGLVIN